MPKDESMHRAADCVTAWVEQRAADQANAVAVWGSGETLSYGELNRRANRLGHHLRSLGVGRDMAVGIYLERSPAMVVAALAVMKAGGAYLPLDPAQPAARLAFMLQDAEARVVISAGRLGEKLPAGDWQVLALDGEQEEEIAAQPDTPPEAGVQPHDLAYVIYTSGSTGDPKGVEVPHSALANLIQWHRRAFQVTESDRATSLASLGFDAAVWEIWPYLSAGASLHLVDERVRGDAQALRDWMLARQITIAFAPTAMAENLLQLVWPANTALRILLTGADVLKKYPRRGLPFTLVNNYGPTESAVVATSGVVAAGDSSQPPSIGLPIDGVQVYILNQRGEAVAEGEAGEIFIGGESLARGYRNRPELTAERFVANPFSSEANAKLYRSGDLGRWLASGEIAFLGRADRQVKIRGYRVEPGEVATVLGRHAAIQTAFVAALDSEAGEKQLVAYLVPVRGKTLRAGELRAFLLPRLPEYMIPGEFVSLDRLPLTANGKVDGAALPNPREHGLRDEPHVDPRTPVEEELARILGPLLKLDRVGVNDNFFLLGGHSLLGTQLIARVSEAFGVDLTLLKLFDHPTVAGMAEEIENLILAKIEADSGTSGAKELSTSSSPSGAHTGSVV
jgi:amino acid adenylation domain-containing protein